MRNLKKILSLVLCMAMMLSVMVVGAGAAFKDQEKIVNEDAVDMCAALNIINGYTDGSFKPEGTITRAEACKMICVALNGGKEPVLGTNATPTFTDIKGHWAEKYIEYCVSEGIVAGIGGGKFNPAGNVTGSQFAKMLLIAIGFNAEHAKFLGAAWEVNVNVKATQKGLYEDLETMDPAVALTRDNAAQMVWNALQAILVEYDYTLVSNNGTLSSQVVVDDKDGDPTLLETKYNALIEVAVMTDAAYNETDEDYDYTLSESAFGVTIPEASSLDVTSLDADEDYSDLVGRTVTVVYKNNTAKDVYGIFAEDAVVVSAPAHTYGTPTNGEVKIDGTKYDIDGDNVAFYAYGDTTASQTVTPASMVNFIDSDDDGEINYATFVPYAVYKVSYAGAKSFTVNNVNYKFDGTGTKYIAYDGIAEDDVVLTVAANNNVDQKITFTKLDVLTGKVASTNGTKVQIDGTWYQTAANTLALGSEYDFSVMNGYVVDYKAASSAVDAEDYVVVADKATAAGWAGNQVKLVYTNGTTEIKDYDTGVTGQIAFDSVVKADATQGATLYTVDDKDADGKVELYAIEKAKATPTADNVGGFDGYTEGAYTKAADKAGKIANMAIAEDAVVFVYNSTDDEVSVITGAELAKLSAATNVNAYYNTSDSTGYDSIVLAFVQSAMVSVSDIQYGYVTADVTTSWDEDDQPVDTVTFWSATGEKTLTTDTANDGKLSIGNYFQYKLDKDGNMTDVVVYGAGQMWAVSAYNGTDITLAAANKTVLDTFEIDEDTVVIYVDSENQAGVEGGNIALCNTNANGNYVLNVLAVAQNYNNGVNSVDKTIDILFVDIANEIQ